MNVFAFVSAFVSIFSFFKQLFFINSDLAPLISMLFTFSTFHLKNINSILNSVINTVILLL